jgi:hypothetical protein
MLLPRWVPQLHRPARELYQPAELAVGVERMAGGTKDQSVSKARKHGRSTRARNPKPHGLQADFANLSF